MVFPWESVACILEFASLKEIGVYNGVNRGWNDASEQSRVKIFVCCPFDIKALFLLFGEKNGRFVAWAVSSRFSTLHKWIGSSLDDARSRASVRRREHISS